MGTAISVWALECPLRIRGLGGGKNEKRGQNGRERRCERLEAVP